MQAYRELNMSDAETARRVTIGTAVMDLRGWRLRLVYAVVRLLA